MVAVSGPPVEMQLDKWPAHHTLRNNGPLSSPCLAAIYFEYIPSRYRLKSALRFTYNHDDNIIPCCSPNLERLKACYESTVITLYNVTLYN